MNPLRTHPGVAAKLLQRAINAIGYPDTSVVEDGIMGRKILKRGSIGRGETKHQ